MNKNQILVMLELQDRLNSIVNPEWRKAGNNWTRAIMVEAVEAIEHHGWKWWKKQELNMPQLQMELIDIMHFMLSHSLEHWSVLNCAENLPDAISHQLNNSDDFIKFDGAFIHPSEHSILENLDTMTGLAACGRISFPLLGVLMKSCDLTADDMYDRYVGKNILNIFRQNNGYKEGTYIKDWSAVSLSNQAHGKLEDNDHLHDIMQTMSINTPEDAEVVFSKLQERYDLVSGKDPASKPKASCKP